MKIGLSLYLWASSARQITAAAAPSETPEQSMMPSMPAILGEELIFSTGTSRWNCAFSLRAPL